MTSQRHNTPELHVCGHENESRARDSRPASSLQVRRGPAKWILAAIQWYQRRVSPYFGPRCRYYPSCSHYAVTAVSQFGAVKGTLMAVWRLMRCNQFSRGGIDDVPPKFRLSIKTYNKDHESS